MKKVIFSYIAIFLVVLALIIWPKIFSITGAEMDYAVMAWIVIFPLASLFFTFLPAFEGVGYGLLSLFLCGAGSLIMPLIVFGATGREYMLLPVIASVLGMAAGMSVSRIFRRRGE